MSRHHTLPAWVTRSVPHQQGVVNDIVVFCRVGEMNAHTPERRAVRCRTRRRRPPKLTIDDNDDDDAASTTDDVVTKQMIFESDIESVVSGCIPGAQSTRRRSLPLLSFLSSTHLAAAEKKRKKEALMLQNSIAEEEARKAQLLNPIEPKGGQLNDISTNAVEEINLSGPQAEIITTTVILERTSTILMPPLLKKFLEENISSR